MAINDIVKSTLERHNLTAKGVIAILMFGAIILVFVLFNFPNQQLGSGQGFAGQVNNAIISLADLQEESQRLEQFYAQFMPGADMTAQRQFIRSRALDNLITSELISQEAEGEGIYSSDAEVRDYIVNQIDPFKEDGKFQKARYFGYLESARITAEEFENRVRKDRKSQKVRQIIEGGALPMIKEVELTQKLDSQQWNLKFAKLDRELLVSKNQPISGQIQAWLADANNIKRAQTEYDSNKPLYMQNEQVNAQHLLIKTSPTVNEETALKKASELFIEAQKGDFAALAKKHSEDSGSKENGGNLGFFGRGQMVPEFESAAFSGKVGDLVGPVKTQFGYHIIKILGKNEKKELPFDEVKNKIAGKIIAETQVEAALSKLETALKNNSSKEIESIVKELNGSFEETGLFQLSAETLPKLGPSDAVKDSVFKLKGSGNWLPTLVRDAGSSYAVQLKEVKASDSKTSLKEVGQRLKVENANQLLESWIEQKKATSKIEKNEGVLAL